MTKLLDEVARAILKSEYDMGHRTDLKYQDYQGVARAALQTVVKYLKSDPGWAEAVKGHGGGIDTLDALASHLEKEMG